MYFLIVVTFICVSSCISLHTGLKGDGKKGHRLYLMTDNYHPFLLLTAVIVIVYSFLF